MLPDDLVLQVTGLRTVFATADGPVASVDGVDLWLRRGETLAVVGESGSGKSVACLSLMRLVAPPGRVVAGQALFRTRDGPVVDLLAAPLRTVNGLRGREAAMVFQEPMTSLNPLYTAGEQVAEVLRHHAGLGRRAAWAGAVEMLRQVRIADPERRAREYPHQLSGGMRQRVTIAAALCCRPSLLIADEPTTALDATVQAQILDLLRDLRAHEASGTGILFVTHNMGVVADIADRVAVMYAGLVLEDGPVRDVFRTPRHPYTRGLLASTVRPGMRRAMGPLAGIPGTVPDPARRPPGCPFAPRCPLAEEACRTALPALEAPAPGHHTRCRRWSEM